MNYRKAQNRVEWAALCFEYAVTMGIVITLVMLWTI